MSEVSPQMLFNIDDWNMDTAHLTAEEEGVYLRLVKHYWRTGMLPNNDANLAAIARIPVRVWRAKCAKRLRLLFQVEGEFLRHPRIDVDCAIARRAVGSPSPRPSSDAWAVIRRAIFERDDFTCQYCGVRGGAMECDHVTPVSKGGKHTNDNLVTACFPCNRSKAAMTVAEWRAVR